MIRALRVSWIAGRDGIAHASRRGGYRTLCGQSVTKENEAWPESRRCPACARLCDGFRGVVG